MKIEMKKIGVFYPVYIACVVIFAVCLIVGLNLLTSYLTAFEASQPIHGAEEIFNKYFKGEDYIAALELAEYQPGAFETLTDASDLLVEMKEGKKTTFYAAAAAEGEAVYNVVFVSAEEEKQSSEEISVQGIPSTKIATIRLVKKSEAGEWGFFGYEFAGMEMFLKGEKSVRVTAPSTAKVSLNGIEIPADFVVEETAHEFNEYLPQGVEGITLLTYEVMGLLSDSQLSCKDKDGIDMTLEQNEESGDFSAKLNYSSTLKETHSDRVMKGMQEYAKYIQNDGRIGLVSQYFDTASMFYRNIAYNLSQFVWDHNSYHFEKEYIDEFYQFDENTFCCHVSFDHVLKLAGREDYVDVLDMIVFVKKKGNNFYIYDRIVQ